MPKNYQFKLGQLQWLLLTVLGIITALTMGLRPVYSQTATPDPATAVKATWNLPNPPTEARVGLRLSLSGLELTNTGGQPWLKTGANAVQISYRWLGGDGKPLDPKNPATGYDELRADLPLDIPANGRVLYPLLVVGVPNAPGDYTLALELVQNNAPLTEKGTADLKIKLNIKPKDTVAPAAQVKALPLFSNSTAFNVVWDGKDDADGAGLVSYDLQYKQLEDLDWRDWLAGTTSTAATFRGENGKIYLFRARAVDRANNLAKYPENAQALTRIDSLPPAVSLEVLPGFSSRYFVVRWSAYDNVSGFSATLCDLQYREGATGDWKDWLNGNSVGSGLFKGNPGSIYYFRARATDYAGNQGNFPTEAQASTTVSLAYSTLYGEKAAIAGGVSATPPPAASPAPTATATITGTSIVSLTTSATPASATTTSATTAPVTTASATTAPVQTPSVSVSATIIPSVTTAPAITATTTITASATPTATVAPLPPPSPNLYFPFVVKNGENSAGTSSLLVTNPGIKPVNVFVRFNERSGAPISTTVNNALVPLGNDQAAGLVRVDTQLKTVAPGETINVWAGGLANSSFNGWIELAGDGSFEANAVRQTATGSPIQYAPARSGKQLYLPYLRKAESVNSSVINLANTAAVPAAVTISYYDSATGVLLAVDKRNISRFGSLRFSVSGAPTADPNLRFSGSAIISADVNLTASVENPLDDASLITYPAETADGTAINNLPAYRELDGLTSTILVQNTTKEASKLKLEFKDTQGKVIGTRELNIAGYGRLSLWLGNASDVPLSTATSLSLTTATPGAKISVSVAGAGTNFKGRQYLN